jgi:lipopolysaccharide transport system ATP-binding protein
VLLLEAGWCVKEGPLDEVIDFYNAKIAEKRDAKLLIELGRQRDRWMLARSGSFEASVWNCPTRISAN